MIPPDLAIDPASPREIAITRVYDAPRELVWRAWTEPAQLASWWGRRGWRTPPESVTMDVRTGGRFRLMSVCEADGALMAFDTVYREVVAPERLTWGEDGRLATVTFTDLGDGRIEMRFHAVVVLGDAAFANAPAGLRSAFDRLAEQLAALNPDDKEPAVRELP
jgi:uncharacterized protein YndB with AHSA1/START domain